jgi:sterol desaturase/sphingolipid hydroxylase (fatty acid hydroxylase superfamily)
MTYDWQAGLAFLAILIVATKVSKFLVFRVPALEATRLRNMELWAEKRAMEKYPPVMRATQRAGLVTNVVFVILVCPFFLTLQPQPWWKILLDVAVILMFYDFVYYLTHRFLFHGQGYFRKVHALHHQARDPSYIDAHYVHPLETFIGVFLFVTTIPVVAMWLGPFHSVTVALAFLVFTQLNIINHCKIELPYFPFKTLSWISARHAAHHENMHKGNYATITLLYDKMFGTFC